MALQGIDSQSIQLMMNQWGAPDPQLGEPKDGFTGAESHNVTTAKYPVGTVVQVANATTGVAGMSQFVYLEVGGIDATNGCAAKHICQQCDAGDPYEVASDAALSIEAHAGAKCAIAISTLTVTGNFAWFWCGGVCPEAFVAALGGMYAAETLISGNAMCVVACTTTSTTLGDFAFGSLTATATDVGITGTTHSAWS